ncbi:restriction endonuclease subunit S [Ligilactobacillus ceti]|uniref:Type i restriction-modification system, specificity subunit s n=1 Tax=Ligilactobacillus ceti DSM 22408 TaxID=1122146 RepID=A0A0R2KR62_9LACO|nr:restriction endonuclease subunit S [Ligilactobacillus ceti]KRN88685.1 type i restriction-modification system, specificity subunit s [Ligilactobacillus ceti DSM 22408]
MIKMKNSTIPWIGEIPEHWEVVRLKHLVETPISDGPHETPVFLDEGIPFYSVDSISNNELIYEPCRYISFEDANRYDKKSKPQKGDILLGKAASTGKIAIIKKDTRIQIWSPLALIRINNKNHNKFIFYTLLSECGQIEIDLRCTSNTQKNISMKDINELQLPLPPLAEQELIANYLDSKCSEIDSIKDAIAKQIEVLKNYKKSLITETVTKGLQKNTPMKNSTIPWIGEIPEHWEVVKVKYRFNVVNGSTPKSDNPNYWNGDIKWITPADMQTFGYINGGSRTITQQGLLSCGTQKIPANSIIVSNRAPIGKINYTTAELCINQGCKALVQDQFNKYYYYFMLIAVEELTLLGRGTTFIELSTTDLSNLSIILPPLAEQEAITNYLDSKCLEIDKIIEDKQNQLGTLDSYKKSVIFEYVTGKKEVNHENAY